MESNNFGGNVLKAIFKMMLNLYLAYFQLQHLEWFIGSKHVALAFRHWLTVNTDKCTIGFLCVPTRGSISI